MAAPDARHPFRLLRLSLTLGLQGLLAASFGIIVVGAGHGVATGFHILLATLREFPTAISPSQPGVLLRLSLLCAVAFGVLAVLVPVRQASAALMLASTIAWNTAALFLITSCQPGTLALGVLTAAPLFVLSLAAVAFAIACLVLRERVPTDASAAPGTKERTA